MEVKMRPYRGNMLQVHFMKHSCRKDGANSFSKYVTKIDWLAIHSHNFIVSVIQPNIVMPNSFSKLKQLSYFAYNFSKYIVKFTFVSDYGNYLVLNISYEN